MDKTSDFIEDYLAHHGVLGMKWGHRNTRTESSSGPSKRQAKKIAKQDKKFEKKSSSLDVKIKLNNSVSEAMNSHIQRINAKYDAKYAKEIESGVLLNSNHRITKAYHKEYNDAALKELNAVASKMTNASGTKRYHVAQNPNDFLGFSVITVDIKHADGSIDIKLETIMDKKGRITGFKVI